MDPSVSPGEDTNYLSLLQGPGPLCFVCMCAFVQTGRAGLGELKGKGKGAPLLPCPIAAQPCDTPKSSASAPQCQRAGDKLLLYV